MPNKGHFSSFLQQAEFVALIRGYLIGVGLSRTEVSIEIIVALGVSISWLRFMALPCLKVIDAASERIGYR